ncbi:MAG: peptide-methionine (S)-S-oxide reductase MsrA [Cyclobacteriaceae bacterium]
MEETATFGSGCFWCTEAVFQRIKGVQEIVSGYTGGNKENPTYEDICTGTTNHAEVIQIMFDSSIISYKQLLELFWKMHDPTTLNKQGNDIGTQYRSVIYYHNDEQKGLAEKYKEKLDKSGVYDSPVVTEISKLPVFYAAEDYHQNYYNLNKDKNPYCSYVIRPKVEKIEALFKE